MLSVMIHGGSGHFLEGHTVLKLPYLKVAIDAAWKELVAGKSGEFAVAAALRVMEGCEYFNAGFGGYPNIHGIVLLDIGMMKGTGHFVSIINLRRVKFPSALALKMLLERDFPLITIWTHELMNALDAMPLEEREKFGWVATHEELVAPHVRKLLSKHENLKDDLIHDTGSHGTVGCVVRDNTGALCAGTSTGGVTFKLNGRVGDSPIIGSGVYADNNIAAISTTGSGEAIMGIALSGYVLAAMRGELRREPLIFNKHPEILSSILNDELSVMPQKYPNRNAALIVMPPVGEPCYALQGEEVSVAMRSGTSERIENEFFRIHKHGGELIEL